MLKHTREEENARADRKEKGFKSEGGAFRTGFPDSRGCPGGRKSQLEESPDLLRVWIRRPP